eukprot:gene6164-4425_t
MEDIEQSFQTWVEHGTVTVTVADATAVQQELKVLLAELCAKLNTRELILPEDGILQVSEGLTTWICQLLEVEDHVQLCSALGMIVRLFLSFRGLVKSSAQQVADDHKFDMANCNDRGYAECESAHVTTHNIDSTFQGDVNKRLDEVLKRLEDFIKRLDVVNKRLDRMNIKLDTILNHLPIEQAIQQAIEPHTGDAHGK